MQPPEVPTGGIRRFFNVKTFVRFIVDDESIVSCRLRDNLPDASRVHGMWTLGQVLVPRFHNGHRHQFVRKSVLIELALDQSAVVLHSGQRIFDKLEADARDDGN